MSSETRKVPIVNCTEEVRRMRGGCGARLMRADDGQHYVVKHTGNPQGGRRALVNEFVSHVLMTMIGVDTPPIAFAVLPDHSGEEHEELHFASRYPGPPDRMAVYDFLPDQLLAGLANRHAFCGALVCDQWTAQADGRQAIFFRARVRSESLNEPERIVWLAQMIDNGYAIQGREWRLCDSPLHGVYSRTLVYGEEVSFRDFGPWIDRAMQIKAGDIEEGVSAMPKTWIEGEEREFEDLICRLILRRDRLPELVAKSIDWLQERVRARRAA